MFGSAHLEMGSVEFLRRNLGFQRFYTLGPIAPNYGSYFGIASINYNDLPVPERWARYVTTEVDDNTVDLFFTGYSRVRANGPTAAENLLRNLRHYAEVGTRFVVVPANSPDLPPEFREMLPEVYRDRSVTIHEIPSPHPYFAAEGCRLTICTRDALAADCQAPARLERLELFMPGWTASVNGSEVPVSEHGALFQQVDLPAGPSEVRFFFRPPFSGWALVAFIFGILALVSPVPYAALRREPPNVA